MTVKYDELKRGYKAAIYWNHSATQSLFTPDNWWVFFISNISISRGHLAKQLLRQVVGFFHCYPKYLTPCFTKFLSYRILDMLFKDPIPSRDAEALEKMQKLILKFLKGIWHVPCAAALQRLRLFCLSHRRVHGDLISMFKITPGLPEFPMQSKFTHPTLSGLHSYAYKFHTQRCSTSRLG